MKKILLLALPLVAAGYAGTQQLTKSDGSAPVPVRTDPRTLLPPGVEWGPAPPSLPPGARIAVLDGDPTKAEVFTMRGWLPDGYRIAPHSHPSYERITVLLGEFQIGMGDTFDESKLESVRVGGYKLLAPGMNHYVRTEGETVIQLHGVGPWQVNYVNPADDPSGRQP